MLPHAVESRSSDSWSHSWSAPSDGCASSRSPSSMSWRVRVMSSSRFTRRPRRRRGSSPRGRRGRAASTDRAGRCRSGRRRTRSPAGSRPRSRRGTPRRAGQVRRSSAGPRPDAGRRARPSASSHERVVPGRIAQSSDGVASSSTPSAAVRTRNRFALVASDRWSSMVRKSASSAPARRASRRA